MSKSIIRLIDSFVPLQMFKVKKLAQPVAPPSKLRLVTIVAYLIGTATFIALLVTQSHSYSTETAIKLTDISDDEWSCSMASIVTQSYDTNATSEPIELFNLMNINELKSDCLSALETVDPCQNDSSILVTTGASDSNYYLAIVSVSAAPTQDSSTFYFAAENQDGQSYQSYKFEAATGILTKGKLGTNTAYNYPSFYYEFQIFQGCSVAMGRTGMGYFLAGGHFGLNLFDFDGKQLEGSVLCEYGSSCEGSMLTNDNYYNVYFMSVSPPNNESIVNNVLNIVLLQNGTYASNHVLTIQTVNNGTIYQIAVFNCGPSNNSVPSEADLTIYYAVYEQYLFSLYIYRDGKSQFVTSAYEVVFIQINGLINMAYFSGFGDLVQEIQSVNATGNVSLVAEIPLNYYSITVFQMTQNYTQIVYPNGAANEILYQYDTLTQSNDVINEGYAGTVAGWYTCGDELVTSGLPASIYSSSSCSSNGLSWQLEYTDTYYATEAYFTELASNQAYSNCDTSTYTTICNKVGNLPPYICSKKQYLPFFTIFGTAIANAHLLTVILFTLSAMAMARLKCWKLPTQEKQQKSVEMSKIASPMS